jgi:aspartate carbamoyltransferase catalytic subunit
MNIPRRKDLLSIAPLAREEIEQVLANAAHFKALFQRRVKKVPTLRGRHVLTLFYEPSTRTHSSFEIAASRLSADVTNFSVSTSSVVKGESILDTIETLESMQVDYIIVRHSASGVPSLIARHSKASVINAGDGWHAHPTQALLDAFTLREIWPDLTGRRIVIVGDLLHSRVARSTSTILHRLGAEVAVLGPGTLIPDTRWEWLRNSVLSTRSCGGNQMLCISCAFKMNVLAQIHSSLASANTTVTSASPTNVSPTSPPKGSTSCTPDRSIAASNSSMPS